MLTVNRWSAVTLTLLSLLGISWVATVHATTLTVKSPPHMVALLELYTSEG